MRRAFREVGAAVVTTIGLIVLIALGLIAVLLLTWDGR
jgi:hypothetical protein